MKPLKTLALVAALLLFFNTGFAQQTPPVTEPDYNKTKLFNSLPQTTVLNIESLKQLFAFPVGQTVSVPLGLFLYEGVIVSKSPDTDKNVQAVVIKSSNFLGSAFTFTKISMPNNSSVFKGRIISRNHSDAFEVLFQNGEYQLIKKHQLRIIAE